MPIFESPLFSSISHHSSLLLLLQASQALLKAVLVELNYRNNCDIQTLILMLSHHLRKIAKSSIVTCLNWSKGFEHNVESLEVNYSYEMQQKNWLFYCFHCPYHCFSKDHSFMSSYFSLATFLTSCPCCRSIFSNDLMNASAWSIFKPQPSSLS